MTAAIAAHAPLGIVVAQRERMVYANPHACALLGFSTDEIKAKSGLADLFVREDGPRVVHAMDSVLHGGSSTEVLELMGLRADGTALELEVRLSGMPHQGRRSVVAFLSDLGDRQRAVRSLAQLAFNDSLTGLATRALFLDRLNQSLRRGKREGVPFAVIFLDLDDFKGINDRHGHDFGDDVLKVVADRLRASVRDADTVARLGGDEFALLLEGADRGAAAAVAEKIARALLRPVALGDHQFPLRACLGISLFPDHGADLHVLMGAADSAMYERKRNDRGSHGFYHARLDAVSHVPFFINWSPEFEFGLPEIDQQHRDLTGRVNALMATISSAEPDSVVQDRLAELVDSTKAHFRTEERYMHEWGLAEVTLAHRQQHQRLIEELEAMCRDWEARSLSQTIQALRDWLVLHIRHTDRALMQHLLRKGAGRGSD